MYSELKVVIRKYNSLRYAAAGSDEQLALHTLLHNVSYRLFSHSERDAFIGFKMYYRTLRKIWSGATCYKDLHAKSGVAILEAIFNYLELETNYVQKQTGEKAAVYICKNEVAAYAPTFNERMKVSWRLCWFSLPIMLHCLFGKKKNNHALLITEVTELAGLLSICKRFEIKKLYDFPLYEVDSNFLTLLMHDLNISIAKMPSPGPLRTHNHSLIGDELMLSTAYQFDELKVLPDIRIRTVNKWLPESAFTFMHHYEGKNLQTPTLTLGYYSHGSWLRQEEGHSNDGLNIAQAEQSLLTDLALFLKLNPQFTLKIFPHPREKKPEMIEKTRAHYKSFFGNTPFQLQEAGLSTSLSFEQVDIALAAFSTIVYERMFCGFKTLIGNYGIPDFPIKSSSLCNICFSCFDEMNALIEHASEQTADAFFHQHQLTGYRYFEYPYYTPRT